MNQVEKRKALLASVGSLQRGGTPFVNGPTREEYESFVNAVGEYLRAEEDQEKSQTQDLKDFATVVNDLATGLETLTVRLRSTAATILGVQS